MMLEENVDSLSNIAIDIAPEEAAENIKGASQFDIEPDNFQELKPYLQPELKKRERPQQVSRAVASAMAQSKQHASVVGEDSGLLTDMEKYFRYTKDVLSGKSIGRRVYDRAYRIARGEKLDQTEFLEYENARDELRELGNLQQKYNYNFAQTVPGEVVGAGYDFAKGLADNYDIILQGAGLGATVGALGGSFALLPGSLVGAKIGAIKGGLLGVGAAQLIDTYKQSSGAVYEELQSSMPQLGTPEAREDEIRSLALGSGVLMSAIGIIPVKAAAKNIPWVAKYVTPKALAKTVIGPQGNRVRQFLVAVGKGALAEGFEEGLQESVQIVAEEIGKTWDGSETKFLEGLDNARVNYEENLLRLGKAASIGAAAGGTFTTVGRAITPEVSAKEEQAQLEKKAQEAKFVETTTVVAEAPVEKPTDMPQSNINPILEGTKAYALKQAIDFYSTSIQANSKLKQLLPNEFNLVKERILEEAGVENVYIDKEELNAWANTQEKADKIANILDPTQTMSANTNAPIRFKLSQILDIAADNPDISEIVKVEPEAPSSKAFFERLDRSRAERGALLARIDEAKQRGEVVTEPEERVRDEDIFDEDAYLEQPTFTEEMGQVIPKSEIFKYNKAQAETRVEVAEAIKKDIDKDMNKVINQDVEMALLFEEERLRSEIESQQNINLVEEYLNNTRVVGDIAEEDQKRIDKGLPFYQINPDSLTANLKSKFLDDQVLKQRKVFSPKGMSLEDVASVFGIGQTELLWILSRTPTLDQSIENGLKAAEAEFKAEAMTNQDYEESATAKAYNNMVKNHIKEMKILREKYWPALKAGIKRVALQLPSMPKLMSDAREMVGSTKIKDLKVTQWKVAERRSQRLAVNAILNNETETAWREKQNAAVAAAMTKYTHIAIGKVNRALKFMQGLSSERNQRALKEAGPMYVEAVNSLMDLFTFDPRNRDQRLSNKFIKYVDKMRELGVNFEIDESVLEWLTTRQSATDLTVDQLLAMTDMMRQVLHQAKVKNKILGKLQADMEDFSREVIADIALENAKSHPNWDENRIDRPTEPVDITDRVSRLFEMGEALLANMQSIVQELDQGILGGFWAEQIYQRLYGIGIHQGAYGIDAVTKMQASIKKNWEKGVKAYGEKEFLNLGVTKVFIPEFRNLNKLKNGKLVKSDLLVMLMNMGNEYNIEALERFGIDRETLMKVLTRELTKKDFDFVQKHVWNVFKGFKPRIAALEKLTTGRDLDFVEPLGFEAFGETYEGGYFPIKYDNGFNSDLESIRQKSIMDSADPLKQTPFYDNPYNGVVRSPHTKARLGSDQLLDLDMSVVSRGFDEVAHDLGMRIPVRDVMMFLKQKEVKEAIIGVVGEKKYMSLVYGTSELTHSRSSADLGLYKETSRAMETFFSYVEGVASISYIALNPGSAAMSVMPYAQIIKRMGPTGAKYISMVLAKRYNPYGLINSDKYFKLAAEIDPSLNVGIMGLGDFKPASIQKMLPKKRWFPRLAPFAKAREATIEIAFEGILGGWDRETKTITILAAYIQFVNGDAPGWSKEKIAKMSKEELHKRASGYAAQLSQSTTMTAREIDKAAIQKNVYGRIISKFWNEPRNTLNNLLEDKRQLKYRAREMVKKYQEGDVLGASQAFNDNASRIRSIALMGMYMLVAQQVARNLYPFGEDEEEKKDPGDLTPEKIVNDAFNWGLKTFTTADGIYNLGAELTLRQIPGLRDLTYAAETERDVAVPVVSMGTSVAKGLNYLGKSTYYMIHDDLTIIEALESISDQELRGILTGASLATGGLPVSAIMKLYKYYKEKEGEGKPMIDTSGMTSSLIDHATYFINKFGSEDDFESLSQEEALARLNAIDTEESPIKQAVADAKVIREKLSPEYPKLDDEGFEIMKFAESGGKWRAYNSKSKAFGIYQFIPSTWKKIVNSPEGREAGLTMIGRFNRDPYQQETAMDILTNWNIRDLKRNDVPVSLESIYFAHHFGVRYAKDIYRGQSDKERLPKGLLNNVVIKANPSTEKIKTVGDMKRYIKDALNRGIRERNRRMN